MISGPVIGLLAVAILVLVCIRRSEDCPANAHSMQVSSPHSQIYTYAHDSTTATSVHSGSSDGSADTFAALTSPRSLMVVPGRVRASATSSADPIVELDAVINGKQVPVLFTTAWAGLFVPGLADGDRVRLQLPIVRTDIATSCTDTGQTQLGNPVLVPGTQKPAAAHNTSGGSRRALAAASAQLVDFGQVVVRTPPPAIHAPTIARSYAILGLGPGGSATVSSDHGVTSARQHQTFDSPVLAALAKRGLPVAFTIDQHKGSVSLSLCVREWPCVTYCWSTMHVAESGTRYRVPLQAPGKLESRGMATSPKEGNTRGDWTAVDLALGNWLTQIPGPARNESADDASATTRAMDAALAKTKGDTATLELITDTQCSIIVVSGLYKTVILTPAELRAAADGVPAGLYAPLSIQLGLSAGLADTTFAVDLTTRRFGVA